MNTGKIKYKGRWVSLSTLAMHRAYRSPRLKQAMLRYWLQRHYSEVG